MPHVLRATSLAVMLYLGWQFCSKKFTKSRSPSLCTWQALSGTDGGIQQEMEPEETAFIG
jgi:hypothetical protein